jgi:hypothetical protein
MEVSKLIYRRYSYILVILVILVIFYLFSAFIPEIMAAEPSIKKTDEIINSNVKWKIIRTIGIDEPANDEQTPYQFYNINSIDCDKNGNIYVLDEKAVHIKVFDKQGKFLKKLFRKGKGPKEIVNIARFAINPHTNNLNVLQEYGYTIKEFDTSGNFIKLHRPPEQFFNFFQFIDENRLILTTFGKLGRLGSKNNFKVLNLKSSKIEQAFAPTNTESAFMNYQRFTLLGNQLWTSPSNEMVLLAYDLKSFKETNRIPIPGKYKKNIIKTITRFGMKGLHPIYFNVASPFLLNNQIYLLVTIQTYDVQDNNSKEFPITSQLSLYRLNGKRIQKVTELDNCSQMRLGTVFDNRLVLYANEPYPRIVVLEINESQ